jgi:hypothetical protein
VCENCRTQQSTASYLELKKFLDSVKGIDRIPLAAREKSRQKNIVCSDVEDIVICKSARQNKIVISGIINIGRAEDNRRV